MPDLATVATFDTPVKAAIARNALEAAGIRAVVADGEIVAMDFLLAPAVGGIKVQVLPEHADRAVEVLEHRFGEHGEALGQEALEAAEDVFEADEPPEESNAPEDPGPPPDPDRESAARRLFACAWIGQMVPPLLVYAVYLWFLAALGTGRLSPRGRLNLIVGSLAVILGMIVWAVILRLGLWTILFL